MRKSQAAPIVRDPAPSASPFHWWTQPSILLQDPTFHRKNKPPAPKSQSTRYRQPM